jgi:glutamate/tyrosine decarboxylase-like PLP-dependent enzyme
VDTHPASAGLRPEEVADLDWDAGRARELTDRMVAIWADLLEQLDAMPATRAEPAAEVAAAMAFDIPDQPMPPDEIDRLMRRLVFEHSAYMGHPGFVAYVSGAGTVPGAAADLLASALNPNSGGWTLSPAATELELHLMRWLAAQFGLPEGSGGLMTSGGATSNLTALKVARDSLGGDDVRRDGVAGQQLAVYASAECHASVSDATDLLGMGTRAVRSIATDEALRMRTDLLREAIDRDVAAGVTPIAVVGSAGTTGTGAIDPLEEIADICAERGIWYHVDAAYGGAGVLAPDLRALFAGIERADSITFDPHKWLYTPQPSASLLVRDPDLLRRSFSVHAAYVHEDRDLTGAGQNIGEMGPTWSRPFMALKVWMSLAAHGLDAYARRISHDVELARYLDAEAERRDELESMAPVTLSIACYRYVPAELPDGEGRDAYLDLLNERLMGEIRRAGPSFPSNAEIGGRYCLRACIVNFRTEADDLDTLLDTTVALGRRLDAELRPPHLAG